MLDCRIIYYAAHTFFGIKMLNMATVLVLSKLKK